MSIVADKQSTHTFNADRRQLGNDKNLLDRSRNSIDSNASKGNSHLEVSPAELGLLGRPGLRLLCEAGVGVAEGVEARVERVEPVEERLEERVCKAGREERDMLDQSKKLVNINSD